MPWFLCWQLARLLLLLLLWLSLFHELSSSYMPTWQKLRVSGLYEFDDFALHCQLFIFFLRRKRVLWPKPKPHLYVNINKCRERKKEDNKLTECLQICKKFNHTKKKSTIHAWWSHDHKNYLEIIRVTYWRWDCSPHIMILCSWKLHYN